MGARKVVAAMGEVQEKYLEIVTNTKKQEQERIRQRLNVVLQERGFDVVDVLELLQCVEEDDE